MKKMYQISITAAIGVIIARSIGMEFPEVLLVTTMAALLAPLLIYIFFKLTRKSVGAYVVYDECIKVTFFSEDYFRKVSTYTYNGRGLVIRATENVIFDVVTVVKPMKVEYSGFSYNAIISGNEITLIIDDLPPKSSVQFCISVAPQMNESVLLKSGLTNCPKTIIKEALEIEYWKPQKLYRKFETLKTPVIKMFCDVRVLSFSIRDERKINLILSWIFGLSAIIGGIILTFIIFGLLNNYITDLDSLNWGFFPLLAGFWGVIYTKDIPMFVRKELK